ncbi:MAG: hypothetical protein RR501_04105 [Cloacibacillus sp.]
MKALTEICYPGHAAKRAGVPAFIWRETVKLRRRGGLFLGIFITFFKILFLFSCLLS